MISFNLVSMLRNPLGKASRGFWKYHFVVWTQVAVSLVIVFANFPQSEADCNFHAGHPIHYMFTSYCYIAIIVGIGSTIYAVHTLRRGFPGDTQRIRRWTAIRLIGCTLGFTLCWIWIGPFRIYEHAMGNNKNEVFIGLYRIAYRAIVQSQGIFYSLVFFTDIAIAAPLLRSLKQAWTGISTQRSRRSSITTHKMVTNNSELGIQLLDEPHHVEDDGTDFDMVSLSMDTDYYHDMAREQMADIASANAKNMTTIDYIVRRDIMVCIFVGISHAILNGRSVRKPTEASFTEHSLNRNVYWYVSAAHTEFGLNGLNTLTSTGT